MSGRTLKAGQEVTLEEGPASDNWGGQRYTLKPGRYKGYVTIEMSRDDWTDKRTGKKRIHPKVWKGSLRSNEVEFTMP